jgi:heparan-alpha-glucosaminide N-acetyltransferase
MPRFASVDALRGFVMFMMIFVNDLAGAPTEIVPAWMRHFHGKSGMTFVDLVFPAFLFIVGVSIPFAITARLARGDSIGKIFLHVIQRSLALLLIGILMVNETPDSAALGWSGPLWATLLYAFAILAFCVLPAPYQKIATLLRIVGFIGLAFLAFSFRGEHGERIITLAPFLIRTQWYGILGLIGWAYLVGSIVFLCFREHRTALLASAALLMCLYPADRAGMFANFWPAKFVGFGETLGSQASITVAGVLLGAMLMSPEFSSPRQRFNFVLCFVSGFAAAALLVHPLYGINKNAATPSWCLWSCAITAALWFLFYWICELRPLPRISKPLVLAGQNVLLAYLLSEMLPSLLVILHLDRFYGLVAATSLGFAIARSALCGVVILSISVWLNRVGFRLRL